MVGTREANVSLTSELVVRDYLDVIPIDLHRQINIPIEMEPGTIPISKALFRIALVEQKSLNIQLQELFDKDFNRPSVSPQGALVPMHRLQKIEQTDHEEQVSSSRN